jgi:hypothetical protein
VAQPLLAVQKRNPAVETFRNDTRRVVRDGTFQRKTRRVEMSHASRWEYRLAHQRLSPRAPYGAIGEKI